MPKNKKKSNSNSELLKREEKILELENKYIRLIAEFENYKKRTTKEKHDFAKYASENIMKSILPIIDDFERANKTNEKDVKGYILIGKKMIDILGKQNLKRIEITKNEPFDSEKHEAISSISVKEKNKKGKVVETVESGYLLLDKIIRYPKVIIGK